MTAIMATMSTRKILGWMVAVGGFAVYAALPVDHPAPDPVDPTRVDVERAIAVGYGGPANPGVECVQEEFDYVCGSVTCYVDRNEQPPGGGDASVDYYTCSREDPNHIWEGDQVCVIDIGDRMKIRDTYGGSCVWRPD
jgi:hypothetical protein